MEGTLPEPGVVFVVVVVVVAIVVDDVFDFAVPAKAP